MCSGSLCSVVSKSTSNVLMLRMRKSLSVDPHWRRRDLSWLTWRTAVAVSVGAHWRQQFTCPTIHVLKYSLSLMRAHIKSATCRSVGAILCVLQPGLTPRLCRIRERGLPLRDHA
ncbi:hypothetical protein PoB_002165200 [Plakobranchus ocellatus]|uniref:Uncharacterized protein n=1 Tax=Plakobranchus ocellatus TaxID=259542 RepID=A0AAV3ZIK1_9GAST|nr:hypothetical protein PoB_002165200 [Plakobranchus ocellatus]